MTPPGSKVSGTLRHMALQLLAVFALAVGGLVVANATFAAPASAAGTCSGSLVYRQADSYAELVVYYSSASSGTNCARTNHLGATYGVASQTEVNIARCSQTSPGPTCTVTAAPPPDIGNYAYYAGPVSVTGTVGRCIQATGGIVTGGNVYYLNTVPKATACS